MLDKLHPVPLCILGAEEIWDFVLLLSTLKRAAWLGN